MRFHISTPTRYFFLRLVNHKLTHGVILRLMFSISACRALSEGPGEPNKPSLRHNPHVLSHEGCLAHTTIALIHVQKKNGGKGTRAARQRGRDAGLGGRKSRARCPGSPEKRAVHYHQRDSSGIRFFLKCLNFYPRGRAPKVGDSTRGHGEQRVPVGGKAKDEEVFTLGRQG